MMTCVPIKLVILNSFKYDKLNLITLFLRMEIDVIPINIVNES